MIKLKKNSFILLLLLLIPLIQLYSRDIEITVVDAELIIPLDGAYISSWDNSVHICDDDGKIILVVPDNRQVVIRANYPGYQSGSLIIPLTGDTFTMGLYLSGIITYQELVIEAQRPGVSETRTGRSVAISGETMERASAIGVVEDVMTSIKLLPGVGYTGMFDAEPSIRGGDPGDMMAVLDGFYIENPYFWGGGFSIFDPNMTASAQLSHGVFSTRYGHTISGLLEVTSKKADPISARLDFGISSSAVNFNASVPLGTKGGLTAMGKLSYWDPFVWVAKQLSTVIYDERLQYVNAISTAPYIRSAEISSYYRFNADLEWTNTIFVGFDGMGADFHNEINSPWMQYSADMGMDWSNMQGFFISGLTWNPQPNMMLKTTAGLGFTQMKVDGGMFYDEMKVYNYDYTTGVQGNLKFTIPANYLNMNVVLEQSSFNAQGKVDFDWDLGSGFHFASGIQELYTQLTSEMEGRIVFQYSVTNLSTFLGNLPPILSSWLAGQLGTPPYYIQMPYTVPRIDSGKKMFNTSAYVLGEYKSPGNKFGAELGLRADHLYLLNNDTGINSMPVLNPRLNLDYNVFRNLGIIETFDITLGTGLFSSTPEIAVESGPFSMINNPPGSDPDIFELKPNRSWTSVIGLKMDFIDGWSFNLEAYYKYVFDRSYSYTRSNSFASDDNDTVYRFNGDGIIWGFDAMIQKLESRYWDGWLSYSFTWAKYHQPERPRGLKPDGSSNIVDSGWYYPNFHRFHNLSLVLNFRPIPNFNIFTRIGFVSGRPLNKTDNVIYEYQAVLLDENGYPVLDPVTNLPTIITRYRRDSYYDDNNRSTFSIPWDLKLSYFFTSKNSKVLTEIYLAVENLFSLFYIAQGNTSYNTYTGQEDTGSDSANYEMPLPMPSFGIKWSF